MRSRKMLTILVLGLVVSLAVVGYSAPMGTAWTYQGRLMDTNEPADGLYDFQLKLYDEPNGTGVHIPRLKVINDIDVIDGYFTIELDFSSSVFNGEARWLEISVRPGNSNDVNDYVTLSPRKEVTPTPYALHTRGLFVDNEENVGIGTKIPTGKLHVNGGKAADSNDGSNIVIKAQDGGDTELLVGSPGGDIILMPGEGGLGSIGVSGPSGKVGIGTANPSEKLDVDGNIDVSSNQIKNYYGFPRPNYDSGWVAIYLGETITLTHGLGGNVDNYVVDLQLKCTFSECYYGINCRTYGSDNFYMVDNRRDTTGAWYKNLGTDTVQIERAENDVYADEMRFRIWVYD